MDRDPIAAWIFLTPALILLGLFLLWPIAYLFYLSFTTGSFTLAGIRWVGGRNYLRLLLDPDFWQVLGNNVYFTLATVIPSLVIPLALAVLLNRSFDLRGLLRTVDFIRLITSLFPVGLEFRWLFQLAGWLSRLFDLRGLLRTAYFIPSITSLVAVGLGFRWLFQTEGPVNALLGLVKIEPIPWLGSTTWAMPVLILLSIWKQLGFNLVVFLAGLQAIPISRYEAAELDGANSWQQFWHITLPGLRPTLVFATVTTAIFTLRSFEQVYIITGGGPFNSTNLLVYYIYDQAFGQFDFGYAAAAATVLLTIALLLVYLQLKVWGEGRESNK